ncbi:MAG: pectin acetylesterase-family hydrolase [Polyangiaceae bacterium]
MVFPLSLGRNQAFLTAVGALLVTAAITGCGDDSTGGGGSGGNPTTGGAGGGDTGGGGAGGGGASPIEVAENEWTYVEFPNTQCMTGSTTGIGVNFTSTSKDVVIFLEGGNACFNLVSCSATAHKNGYSGDIFASEQPYNDYADYFDRTKATNPWKDYNYVYVPYCTGDVHAGDAHDVDVAGIVRQFQGFRNMGEFLKRIVATFPDAEHVVLSGFSAGGFGAAYNYDQVAQAFGPNVDVTLIDDSGPPMASDFVAPCLQKHLYDLWGLGNTLPAGCTDCNNVDGTFTEEFMRYIIDTYPDARLGLISSEDDKTISNFWGFGEMDCSQIEAAPLPYPAGKYKAGLEDLRDRVGAGSNFRLYMIPGNEHVWLDNGLDMVTIDGVKLEDWVGQGIAADPAWPNVSAP